MLNKIILCFFIYSFFGWVYEIIFCIIKTGEWENRGFLYGPICPIYGVGATILYFLISSKSYTNIHIFLISFFGSLVLEYFTSLILELLFHAVWWDYSNVPLNINGRTSVITSIGFGFGGILIVDNIIPFTNQIVNNLNPLSIQIITYLLIIIFTFDMTMTITALSNFRLVIENADKSINKHMVKLVSTLHSKTNMAKEELLKLSSKFPKENIFFKLAVTRVTAFRPPSAIKNKFEKFFKQNKKTNRGKN